MNQSEMDELFKVIGQLYVSLQRTSNVANQLQETLAQKQKEIATLKTTEHERSS